MGSTLTLVGLLGLWFYINPDLGGAGVYLLKNIRKSGTNTSSVNITNYQFVKGIQSPICKRNTVVDVYGDPGCPDNPRREHLCALFQAWTSACKEYGINYTLAFGSLLGAMRSKDVIPWDHDIDINIHVKHFPILKRWSEEQKFTKEDETIRLAIQPGPVQNIPEEKRTRHNCKGEVFIIHSLFSSFLKEIFVSKVIVSCGCEMISEQYFLDQFI